MKSVMYMYVVTASITMQNPSMLCDQHI